MLCAWHTGRAQSSCKATSQPSLEPGTIPHPQTASALGKASASSRVSRPLTPVFLTYGGAQLTTPCLARGLGSPPWVAGTCTQGGDPRPLLQGQSRQGCVHHVQYDSRPSLSWQQTVREQGPENSSHLREASADECQQPSMLPLMGRILLPRPQPPDSRALPPPSVSDTRPHPGHTVLMLSWKSAPVPCSHDLQSRTECTIHVSGGHAVLSHEEGRVRTMRHGGQEGSSHKQGLGSRKLYSSDGAATSPGPPCLRLRLR